MLGRPIAAVLFLACLSGCGSPKPSSDTGLSDEEIDEMADDILDLDRPKGEEEGP